MELNAFFEKENIWTFDSKGELLLTIMSSLAQEESRNISENTRWGMRKAFQNGKVFVPFRHFLGYDRGANGGNQGDRNGGHLIGYGGLISVPVVQ